jgi:hypothetical protein
MGFYAASIRLLQLPEHTPQEICTYSKRRSPGPASAPSKSAITLESLSVNYRVFPRP